MNRRIAINFHSTVKNFCSSSNYPSFAAPLFIPDSSSNKLQNEKFTKISKLQNGLTIASQNQYSFNTTIGAFVRCGPRYEVSHKSGVSHFIEKLSFQSTENFPNVNDIHEMTDKCSALFDCVLSRDFLIYGMCGKSESLKDMVNILSDVILKPRYTNEEFEIAREMIIHESHIMRLVPPPDNLISDLVHQAAYRNNTLGLPRYTPSEMINVINKDDIVKFRQIAFQPQNIVLVGVGCEHSELKDWVEQFFVPKFDTKITEQLDKSTPQMTGGEMKIEQDLEKYHNPMPEYAYISIGLEGPGYNNCSEEYVTSYVLQYLLGGGSSFSSGGPGKGMYTRFYTNIMNRHGFVNSAVALTNNYQDTGLFTMTGSACPNDLKGLTEVIIKEFLKLSGDSSKVVLDESELNRAKSLAKTAFLMNLEIRNVVFHDIGRQILYSPDQATRKHADELIPAIERVSKENIVDLVQLMITSNPSIAGFGRLKHMPEVDSVRKMLINQDRFIPRIFQKFL